MLNTLRRDRRTRRQASFNLEALDDRLVLSAAAAGAVAGVHEHRLEVQIAQHEAKLDRLEARHEAKLATKEAKQEAKISQLEAKAAGLTPVTINSSGIGDGIGIGRDRPMRPARRRRSPRPRRQPPRPSRRPRQPESEPRPHLAVTTSPPAPAPARHRLEHDLARPAAGQRLRALQSLYQEYESAGGGSSFTPSQPSDKQLQISGDSVGVSLKMNSSGNFSTFLSQLQSDGLQVTSSSATYGLVDGMLPIGDLRTIAQVASSVTPMSPPASVNRTRHRHGWARVGLPPGGPARAFLLRGRGAREARPRARTRSRQLTRALLAV